MSRERSERICSLDGLRAISIALVIVSHLGGTRGFPLSLAATSAFWIGHLGVHVFFVISGFLITRLLLDETVRHGRIDIGRFYFRRTLRIFPAYYTLIAVIALLQAKGLISGLAPHEIAHSLTYTSDYYGARSWYTGHTWSLSVEEQFYLLWPAAMVLLGTRRALLVAAGVVLLGPVVRLGEYELRWAVDNLEYRFENVADAIAIGCVLACLRDTLHGWRPYRLALASPLIAVVPVAMLVASGMHEHPHVFFGASFTVMNVGAAICLDWSMTYADGRVGRLLNARPVVVVGLMSYSLYLWQQLFMNRDSSAAIFTFPLSVVLAFATAAASYLIVERPMLRLRRWLEIRRADVVEPAPVVRPAAP